MDMSVSRLTSFKGSLDADQTTNILDKYKRENIEIRQENDKIVLSKDLVADLKYNAEKASVGTILEGYVNNKQSVLKFASNNDDEEWLEGAINKKYVLLHAKNKVYDGKYGNSEFNLTIDYNSPSKISKFYNHTLLGRNFMPDYCTIKGTFNGKEIDIKLPNVKIPEDHDLRDILTLMLEDNGLKAQTINGEVKSIKFSYTAIKNIKKKAEKREKMIHNDIKPIFMQGVSSATGLIVGSIVSAMLLKFGLRR